MNNPGDMAIVELREEILDYSRRHYLNVDEVQRFYSLQEEWNRRERRGTLYSIPRYRDTWQDDKGKDICAVCRFLISVKRYRGDRQICKFNDPEIPAYSIRYPVTPIGCLSFTT